MLCQSSFKLSYLFIPSLYFCCSHGNHHFSNRGVETEGLNNPDFDILEAAFRANHAVIIDLVSNFCILSTLSYSFSGPPSGLKSYKGSEEVIATMGQTKERRNNDIYALFLGQRDERTMGRILTQLGCEFVFGEVGVSETGKEVTG